jgi:hypothetical protein
MFEIATAIFDGLAMTSNSASTKHNWYYSPFVLNSAIV